MKQEKKTPTRGQTSQHSAERTAYMIAWRDRYIQRLEEALAGREEERALLCSLLYGTLIKGAEGKQEAVIDKAELKATLGRFACTVENGDTAYTVRFTPLQEAVPNGESQKG